MTSPCPSVSPDAASSDCERATGFRRRTPGAARYRFGSRPRSSSGLSKEALMRNDISARDTALALHDLGLYPIAVHPPGVRLPDKTTVGKEPINPRWGESR